MASELTQKKHHPSVRRFKTKLITRLIKTSPPFLDDCEFRPVRSRAEFKAATLLLVNQYSKKGYVKANKVHLYRSIHRFHKKSSTLVAIYKGKYVIGTMTMIEDSSLELPMDKIYRNELNLLRMKGRKLAETGRLAMNDNILGVNGLNLSQANRMLIMLYMIKAMTHYYRNQTQVDMMVACFHPNHAFFYEGMMMTPLAGLKSYDAVNGSPALGYKWDLSEIETHAHEPLPQFFGFGTQKIGVPRSLEPPHLIDMQVNL